LRDHLIEGLDYYKEGGRCVFTEAYHMKRGFCCNGRCRHCPWRENKDAVTTDSVTIFSGSIVYKI